VERKDGNGLSQMEMKRIMDVSKGDMADKKGLKAKKTSQKMEVPTRSNLSSFHQPFRTVFCP